MLITICSCPVEIYCSFSCIIFMLLKIFLYFFTYFKVHKNILEGINQMRKLKLESRKLISKLNLGVRHLIKFNLRIVIYLVESFMGRQTMRAWTNWDSVSESMFIIPLWVETQPRWKRKGDDTNDILLPSKIMT